MVEEKFFAVNQSPEDILVRLPSSRGRLLVVFSFGFLFQIAVGQLQFVGLGCARVNPIINFPHFFLVVARLVGCKQGGAALVGGQFILNFFGVKQVQALRQAGILGAFALARAR